MKNFLLGFLLTFLPLLGFGQILEEGFDDITTLTGSGWTLTNQSEPLGLSNWFQGNDVLVFPSHSGASDSYIGANFENTSGAGNISNWLITPTLNLKDGDKMTFWTRTTTGSIFDDRLEVRSSVGTMTAPSGGASDVGSFTTVNLVINDDYSLSYPQVWTEYEIVVSGVGTTPVAMNFAFRYNVLDGGPSGSNSDYIGIDSVVVEEGEVIGGDPCDEKTIMNCDETYTFELVPGAGEWVNYTDVTWNYAGSEKVWEFTAPTTGSYTFELDEGEEDADFFLMDACSNTAVNLSDGYWTGTDNETVTLTEGVTYYLIADLFASSPTTVSVTVVCPDTEPTDEYCEPLLDCEDGDLMTNVTFEEINNTTTCSPDGYGDYTDQIANVEAGQTYPISVTVGSGWTSESVSVWVDYNNNFIFDEDEFTYIGTGSGSVVSGDITIPVDLEAGEYRMRVRVAAVGEASATWDMACDEEQVYGETEDYTINVGGGSTGEDCDQGDDSNGFENGYQIGSGTDFENADDFMVSAGNTLNVQTIELNVISAVGPMESIGFTFYDDNAGSPGSTVVESVTGLVPYEQFVIGSAFGFDVYAIYVDVDLNFDGGASGSTYWMQPMAVAPGGAVGGYFWEITSAGSLGSPIHTSELGGAWTPNVGENAVFKLYCEDVTPPPPPCVFDITTDVEPITRVDVADIDNVSDATVNGSPALEDFTAVVGNMAPGESYDIALEGNTAGDFTTFFTVFIDWNQDGDWTDADEMYEIGSITNSTGTDGQQATGTITVPAGAMEGSTVMRVIKNFNTSPTNPCGTYSFGQGEDYTINVGEVEPPQDCNQEVLSNGLENGLFLGGADNQRLAVDVTVAANTQMTISAIEPTIIVPEGGEATTFSFVFYTDEGGLPGAEVDNATGTITSSTVTGQNFGRDFIRYAVDLDAPVILEAGTYWMEMTSDAEGWEATTASVLGSTLVFNNVSTSGAWINDGTGTELVYEIVATCETLGVDDMSSFDFAYYPNPVKDVLNITSNKTVENVSIYNLAGQQVLATAKVNNGQVNLSALSSGVYVFRATLQGGQVETFKIIKK